MTAHAQTHSPQASDTAAAQVVTKAVVRAAEHLGIQNSALARILGLSEPTISRMKRQGYQIAAVSKEFELAVLLIRLYRSLDSITGGDETVSGAWLKNANTALGGKPLDQIQTISGLMNVIAYLDSRRAVV